MCLFYEREVKENTSPHLAFIHIFSDGQPTRYARNFFFPSQPYRYLCLLADPLRLSSCLVFLPTMVLSGPHSGLPLYQVLRRGKPLGQALFAGATTTFVALLPLPARGTSRLLPFLADRVPPKLLPPTQLSLSACSNHTLLRPSTPSASLPPASALLLASPSLLAHPCRSGFYKYSLSAHPSAPRWPLL